MNRFRAFWIVLLLSTGCAAQPRQYASNRCARPVDTASAQVCKHCNCIMPAGTNWDAQCTVCDCGYQGHQCLRGSSKQ